MNEIRELLNLATEHEGAAREARRTAGRLLATMRETVVGREEWLAVVYGMGLDPRTVAILIQMAAGGSEMMGST